MNTCPTEEQKQLYCSQGFLVVDHFLDAAELDRWRDVVDAAVAARGGQRMSFAEDSSAEARALGESEEERRYYEQVFTQRINLWQTDDGVRRLIVEPAFSRFAGELAGVDGLRLWVDQAFVKPPFGNPTAYHLDVPFWSFRSPDAITIWVALDDATIENGCLYYVPGSHKAGKYDNVRIGNELGALFDVYPEWSDVTAVAAPVPAGGALFHNGLTFHGAGANMTPRPRRAMTCAYMPAGSTFNGQPNALPPAYLRALMVGDLLDNEAQNPLVYARHA